jgi:hypothetical protein
LLWVRDETVQPYQNHEAQNGPLPRQRPRARSHQAAGCLLGGLETIGLTPGAVLRHSDLPPTVYSGETFVTPAQNFAIYERMLKSDVKGRCVIDMTSLT